MRVLVTYAKTGDGTEELARAVVEGLVEARHSVVLAATKVDAMDRWDAVVVVGTRAAWSWPRGARTFVLRHLEALGQVPVWFLTLDPTGRRVRSVNRLARLVGARCHQTVGGRALPATHAWARSIGVGLNLLQRRPRVHVPRGISLVRRLVVWLCVLTGVTAVAGGIGLLTAPTRDLLRQTPEGYLVPGLILLLAVGLGNLLAAALEARRIRRSELAVSFAGAALTGWTFTQLINRVSWLQLVYFLVGLCTLASARWLWRVRHRLASGPQTQV
jgi:hypothetical protein